MHCKLIIIKESKLVDMTLWTLPIGVSILFFCENLVKIEEDAKEIANFFCSVYAAYGGGNGGYNESILNS